MRKLLPFLLLALMPLGHAQSPAMSICKLSADLKGDAFFYMTYGRDAWHGKGDLVCEEQTADGGLQEQHRPVEINYNSTSGVAVGEFSQLHLDVAMATSKPLNEINVFSHVFSTGATERALLQWRVQTGEYHMVISVDPGQDWRALSSLREGNLYIR